MFFFYGFELLKKEFARYDYRCKKMNNYLFPIYVHVLKERCKQLAQYLTKVQLMTNVA